MRLEVSRQNFWPMVFVGLLACFDAAAAQEYAQVVDIDDSVNPANLRLTSSGVPDGGEIKVRGGIPNIVQAWRADDKQRECLQFGFNTDATEITVYVPTEQADLATEANSEPFHVDCLTAEQTTLFTDGRIVCSALDAKVVGKRAKLESHPGSHRIGYWSDHDDYVTWHFDTDGPIADKYEVELVYSRAGSSPCKVTVQIDGNDLLTEIVSTGSWYRYRVDAMGTASLRRNSPTHQIKVKSRGSGGAVMNLKAVVLSPIGDLPADLEAKPSDHGAKETLASETVDFNRDIRPILSDKCFHCHGPDAANQDSEFRLDSRDNIFADLGGYFGVVPGDLNGSELHTRIHSTDEGDMMPPPDSNRQLSTRQVQLLDRWIQQGAPYADHWSFELPRLIEPPKLSEPLPTEIAHWAGNPIDAFVIDRLRQQGLSPAPQADLLTLFRRVCLTLTGLPPTPEQIDALLADDSEQKYEHAVDRLLTSMHYAEHQTLRWLDAARFADTDGYQNDNGRANWPWRDWVINAFKKNMPFDQFTIEQLAGDMLPDATDSQVLASTFNRNHRQNSEGGALAAEFLVENVIDRVETTSTVFLGLTMGCCRCHDHKYDPLSQQDFYQFYGYFNNIGEKGIGKGVNANPVRKMSSPLSALPPRLEADLDSARAAVASATETLDERMESWIRDTRDALKGKKPDWVDVKVISAMTDKDGTELTRQDDASWKISGKGLARVTYTIEIDCADQDVAAIRLDALPDDAFTKPRRLSHSVNGNFVVTDFRVFDVSNDGEQVELPVAQAFASFEQDKYPVAAAIDSNPKSGWAIYEAKPIEKVQAMFALQPAAGDMQLTKLRVVIKQESSFRDHNIGRFRLSVTDNKSAVIADSNGAGLNGRLRAAITKPEGRRSEADRKMLREHYKAIDSEMVAAQKRLQATQERIDASGFGKVSVMVMSERSGDPAPIYLLKRGQYNEPDKSKELRRALPRALLDQDAQPSNRLELARWLVSPQNPLTARVTVNRYWQDHFGVGLVKTSEDFGLQGETPSHPDLLDWLANEFVRSGWDVRAIHRLIVTSATYRQSSKVDAVAKESDPENRLLARGPRYRMDGFSIRDAALQASGLLNDRVGGPPVKPYQPTGLWNVVASGPGIRYSPDKRDKLYRKSMYTYWKRAVNPPRQIIFDSGSREVCNVRARVTNTPLQALVLMNDQTFWEAARHVAQRILRKSGFGASSDLVGIGHMVQLVTGLNADESELQVLQDSLQHYRKHFSKSPEQAAKLLSVGDSPRDESLDIVEHAAWTVVAHILLNLDETITIE